jgi:predicted acetyltransferase
MEIRTITDAESDAFFLTLSNAFGEAHPDPEEVAGDRVAMEIDRTFAAFDDGQIVGCAAIFSQQMTVAGGETVPTAGVTMVGVLPTHRRRGVLRELMTRMLDQAADRGEPLATLFASQASIYGRFGFARSAPHLSFDVALDRVKWGTESPAGSTRLLSREDALPAIHSIHDRAVRQRAGGVVLDPSKLANALREQDKREEKPFYAIREDPDGHPDAFAIYRTKHEWPRGLPSVELKVHQLVAATREGGEAMWRFLFDVDLVSKVTADTRPIDDPLLLGLDEPRALRPELDDGLFLRPLDVVAALEGRAYAADGVAALRFHDDVRPEVSGTYELAVEDGRGTCRRVERDPDVAGHIHAFGATYLGGATWSAVAAARRVDEYKPGALATLDAMFATSLAPWAITYF